MRIGGETSTWHAGYTSSVTDTANKNRSSTSSQTGSSNGYGDSVTISDEARRLAESMGVGIQLYDDGVGGYMAGQSTAGVFAGASNTGLRKYMNLGAGTGDTSLTAMNMNRKALGGRIDSIIKGLGINLAKDEKLTISVDSKNQIVVGGIKDKAKAKSIQDALNNDKKLGRDMRKHVATGKITEYAQKQEAYEKQMGQFGVMVGGDLGENTAESFTSPGMRSFIIEEYLQENAGVSLSDLSIEKGADGSVSILGMNSELNALLSEDAELGATIANILENGQSAAEFKVSFEFANGAISDSTTADAAKSKIEGVKAKLMGQVNPETGQIEDGIIDQFRDQLESVGGEMDEKFMAMLSRGFSIRVGASGSFEILGAEDLDVKLMDTLKGLVQKALDSWAEESSEAYGSGRKIASFADVAQTYIEQHRFEHGDVDEYEHLVEINFAGGSDMAKVVSPEADKAQDEANRKVAGELGEKLKGMLAGEGINTEGLEMEIDETGKITVLGSPDNAEVKRAQNIIDQFVQETKSRGKVGAKGDEEEEGELARERRRIRDGEADPAASSVATPANVVATGDAAAGEAKWKAFVAEKTEAILPYLPDKRMKDGDPVDPESKRIRDIYVGWQRNLPRDMEGTHYSSNVDKVSSIRAPKFASALAADAGGKVNPFGVREDDRYADDAAGLYLALMDGMTQFHDDRRKMTYSLSA